MTEPVAVIGTAALLPGSPGVAEFWRILLAGRDLMTDVPSGRWLIEDHYDPDPRAVDKTYGRRGAFLPEVPFDPLRYGIPPTNLSAIDTSQLLGLVVADQVLADCVGKPADPERVSVFIGASGLERMIEASARLQRPVWLRALREQGVEEEVAQAVCERIAAHYVPWQEETFPGLLTNLIAGRIAGRFDLHGANHTTDAACASSLAALYSGVAELSLRRSDLVITGGVDTMNDVTMYTCFSRTPALSPTGDCRPFSADADGTMLGEGLVLFALKRLTDAERDGDRIYAVVRGVGASSDGRGTAIYAPAAAGQARALRRAYEAAGYGPETVEMVEAHGTGTSAGDAAEFAALREVFGAADAARRQWCALGSVKSQIGHTKAAAGAAGLLKAVLAVHHKVLPPTIKVDRPHPALDIDNSPFYLNTAARPWIRPPGTHPRRASVSSFGFGGTNFHVTIEEHPEGGQPQMPSAPTELVLFSADSVAGLRSRAVDGDLTEFARRSYAEFDATAPVRLCVVAADVEDLRTKLAEAAKSIEDGRPLPPHLRAAYAVGPASPGRIGFLFPGQGAQYPGMGGDLAIHLDLARRPWDRAARLELADQPLHRVVFPPPAFTDAARAKQEAELTATEWAQPALAVHSLALLEILAAIGVAPDCVAGHSFGELVALHAAGAYDADTLVRLARRRGELMAAAGTGGAMLAVAGDRETVTQAIAGEPDVWLVNHNGPRQVVLAGTVPALEAVAARLGGQGLACTRLNAGTAFHSPMVAPASPALLDFLSKLEVSSPRLPVYGNASGREYPADADAVRDRLAAQLREPVAFVDLIEAMYAAGVRTFVEVGAGTALTGLAGQILGERPHLAVALDRRGRHGLTSLQEGLGRLAVQGVSMDLRALTADLAPAPAMTPLSASAVRLDGGNYGRPRPGLDRCRSDSAIRAVSHRQESNDHEGVTPAPPRPPLSNVDGDWLRAVEDVQQRLAEAHGAFQRALTDSHMTYLKMAETTIAGLLGATTTAAPLPTLTPPAPSAIAVPPAPSPIAVPPAPSPIAVPPPPSPIAVPPPPSPIAVPPPPSPIAVPPPPAGGVEIAATSGIWSSPGAKSQPYPGSGGDLATNGDRPEQTASNDDIAAFLLSVVADRTGYPVEILNLDMALEADLGIDSIKRVEILSALRNRIGDLPAEELSALTKLRTLREVVDRFKGKDVDDDLVRRTLRLVPAAPSGLCLPGLRDGTVAVTDDGGGVAALVVEGLGRNGIQAQVVEAVSRDARGVVLLEGLRSTGFAEARRSAFAAVRAVAARMETEGGAFVVVYDAGGGAERADHSGLVALARTAAKEWPLAAVKAIGCATTGQAGAGRGAQEVADAIVAELAGGAGAAEVCLSADGTRVVPQLVDSPPDAVKRERIGPHSVIVVSGGARGATAAAMRELAGRYRPRLVLLGRTALSTGPDALRHATDEAGLIRLLAQTAPASPAELTARAREVLAGREIHESLAAFERAGAQARYVAVDVRDRAAVSRALDEVRREWGPITGVVHGAGVLADSRLADKTDEQFERVFATKVDGLRALLDATAGDPLEVLCAFSSVAAVLGNPGQADYAMANEVLHHMLAQQKRARPDCLVRAIAWGPWAAGMVTPTLAERFRANGVPLIEPAAGGRAFVAELGTGTDEILSVLTPPGDVVLSPLSSGAAVVAEVVVNDRDYPYLSDHRVGGVSVLPVATVLDWFAGVAVALHPNGSEPMLKDLRVLDKVTLPRLADDGERFTLRTNGNGIELLGRDGRAHYRVTTPAADPPPPRRWTTPASLEPHEEPYQATTLFHGPVLRCLLGAPGVGIDGAVGAVSVSPTAGWVDVVAVDGVLQLALLWARRAGTGDTLPMAIDEIRLHGRNALNGNARCVVHAVSADDTTAVCDAALLDGDGRPRVELLGVRLVRRPGS